MQKNLIFPNILKEQGTNHVPVVGHWGPLHTQHWGPVTIALQALSLVEKAELVQVHFTLCLTDQRSKWLQVGCKLVKSTWIPAWHQNGSCFMVTWTISKNHLLEVGLTQNQETIALRHLTVIDLFLFIMCEDPTWILIHWNRISLRPGNIWLHTTLEGPWPHYTILAVSWDGLWTLVLDSHNFMVTALGSCVKWPWLSFSSSS
jgi:hypothetical protein